MGGFTPYGAFDPAENNGNTVASFLTELIQGYQGSQKARQDMRSQKQEQDFKQQEINARTSETKLNTEKLTQEVKQQNMAQAATRLEALRPALLQNPALRKDPNYIKSVADSYTAQGLPAPIKLNADGTQEIDVKMMGQKHISDLPQDQQKLVLTMEPAQRKPYLDDLVRQGYDIPKEFYTTNAYLTAKDKLAIDKLAFAGVVEKDRTRIADARTAIRKQMADATEKGDVAKVAYLQARTAATIAGVTQASARLQQGWAQIQNTRDSIKNVMTRFQQSPHGAQANLMAQQRGVLGIINSQEKTLVDAQSKYNAALAAGADEEDPAMVQTQQQIEQMTTGLNELKEGRAAMMDNLLSGKGTASSVAGASGVPTRVVGGVKGGSSKPVQAAPGVKDGTVGGGGKYVAKGGQWYAR